MCCCSSELALVSLSSDGGDVHPEVACKVSRAAVCDDGRGRDVVDHVRRKGRKVRQRQQEGAICRKLRHRHTRRGQTLEIGAERRDVRIERVKGRQFGVKQTQKIVDIDLRKSAVAGDHRGDHVVGRHQVEAGVDVAKIVRVGFADRPEDGIAQGGSGFAVVLVRP